MLIEAVLIISIAANGVLLMLWRKEKSRADSYLIKESNKKKMG